MLDKASLADKFSRIPDYWNPRIVGELNGQQVKLAKFLGEFIWHAHEYEDEFFLVVKGSFRMELRDKHITLNEGDFLVVPRGVEHRPVADEEAHIMMFEPATTINTGAQQTEKTITKLERL